MTDTVLKIVSLAVSLGWVWYGTGCCPARPGVSQHLQGPRCGLTKLAPRRAGDPGRLEGWAALRGAEMLSPVLLAPLVPPVRVLAKAPPLPAGYRRVKVYDFSRDVIFGEPSPPKLDYFGPACLPRRKGSDDVAALRRRVARATGVKRLNEQVYLARALWVRYAKGYEPLETARRQGNRALVAKLKARFNQALAESERLTARLVTRPRVPPQALCFAGRLARKNTPGRIALWERFLKAAPTHRAANGIRLELAAKYLGSGRGAAARVHLARVSPARPKARVAKAYLEGLLAYQAGRFGTTRRLWHSGYQTSLKHGWKRYGSVLRRELLRLAARTLGTGDPVRLVQRWIGAHEPKQVTAALGRLASHLLARGEYSAGVRTLEGLLLRKDVGARARGRAVVSILEAYINQGRQDLAYRRAWSYLVCVAHGKCDLPDGQTLSALERVVRSEATALHAQALQTRERRHAELARHLYLLHSLLPGTVHPKGARVALALRRAQLELFIQKRFRQRCVKCPRPRFSAVPRPRPRPRPRVGKSGRVPKRRARTVVIFTGRPRIYGSLDARTIRRTIRRQQPQLKACYEDALEGRPRLKGKIRMRFGINSLGHTDALQIVVDTTGNAALRKCVLRKAATWRFPEVWNLRTLVTCEFSFVPVE